MSASPPPHPGPGRDPLNRPFFLPRLPAQAYQGKAIVHWTLSIQNRQTGWLTDRFHLQFRELLLHTLARGHLFCASYVLMPDHLHLLWMGCSDECDQRTSMAFFRTHTEPLLTPASFQHQPHDHVLKSGERRGAEFEKVANYILENPVRTGLVNESSQWPHLGSLVPGYPRMHPLEPNFWGRFWRVYYKIAWGTDLENEK